MRAALVRVTLAAALCLSVTGCGDDSPAPKPYSGPSKSATPSGAPSMPAAAKGTTEASAKAFVAYYFRVLSYATRNGDIDRLDSLGAKDCETCTRLTTGLTEIYKAGGKIQGRGYEPRTLRLVGSATGASVRIEGSVQFFPQVTVESRGARAKNSKGGPEDCRFELSRDGSSWSVSDWKLL